VKATNNPSLMIMMIAPTMLPEFVMG